MTMTDDQHDGKRPPRRFQWGMRDDEATAEQLAARHRGAYDPRPASGARGEVLVHVRCARCGRKLVSVVRFETRPLFNLLATGDWSRELPIVSCPDCGRIPLDGQKVSGVIAQSLEDGKRRSVRTGGKVTPVELFNADRADTEKTRRILGTLYSVRPEQLD